MATDNRHPGSLKPEPRVYGVELHACDRPGEWVGITDSSISAATIHGLWIEGYDISVVPLHGGKMQVQVTEGLSEPIRNAYEEED
ncbi:hypothetical protein [Halobacterium sp. KA-6]|uniref:hypothetical protein n=1 Tax=Halobacterium sp. KA-6 TaxID=2896368 RepID=UPI001E519C11|nr:hypothetical protein [Halobacterium sp. KA-6]MCD2202750.1 hypothetical protein [Halobacterium sp. KA-6]